MRVLIGIEIFYTKKEQLVLLRWEFLINFYWKEETLKKIFLYDRV